MGVIAAITISSIHRKWFDSYSVSAVRNSYILFDTAIKQMFLIEGQPMKWDWPEKGTRTEFGITYTVPTNKDTNLRFFANKFSKYLEVTKLCYTTRDGCFNYGIPTSGWFPTQYWLNGTYTRTSGLIPGVNNNAFGMILKNGMHVSFFSGSYSLSDLANYHRQNGGYRGMFFMRFDINGPKGPNRWGYDIFAFDIDSKGVILDDPNTSGKKPTHGRANGAYGKQNCKDKNSDGKTCALWIMRHGNVDYKYRDVSDDW